MKGSNRSDRAVELTLPMHRRFRPEIEGLRAVASLLVVAFHLWLGRPSGGVDVFFVVAGFLITHTLASQINNHGRIDVARYFARLGRRLLPTASVVLAATVIATFLLLPKHFWNTTFEQVVASALYVENWYLALNAVDYMSTDESKSPLQHFWAMSVQGQFYLLWLVLFFCCLGLAMLFRARLRVVLLTALIVLFAGSLAFSIIDTLLDQPFAYFSTFARIWEFALGGLVAFLPQLRIPGKVAAGLSWIGLGALLATGLVFSVGAVFPGAAALVPTMAAVLIIVTGNSDAPWSATRLLGSRLFVWLGSLGYGIYLWHWPVLIFTLQIQDRVEVGLLTGVGIVALSIALAWVTRKLLEDPFARAGNSAQPRARRVSALAAAALLLGSVAVGASAIQHTKGLIQAEHDSIIALVEDRTSCFGAAAFASAEPCDNTDLAGRYFPEINPREDEPELYASGCITNRNRTEFVVCSWAVRESPTRIAIIGNSHAASWFPAVRAIAQSYGWRLDTYVKSTCTYNTYVRTAADPRYEQTCAQWNEKLTEHLAATEAYDYVITSANGWNDRFKAADGREDPSLGVQGYLDVWRPMIERGSTIIAIRDYAFSSAEVIECALRNPASPECFRTAEEAIAPLEAEVLAVAAMQLEGVELLDMNEWFCRDGVCPAVIGNVHVYRDAGHFTKTYGETLTPFLLERLQQIDGFPPLPSTKG